MGISEILKKDDNAKYKPKDLSEKESFELIGKWAKELEVRLKEKDMEDVKQEIWIAVSKKRLVFDSNTESFTYVFKKPIVDESGSIVLDLIKISEIGLEEKRQMLKEHENKTDDIIETVNAYCKKDNGSDIEIGFIMRIGDRDLSVISAVVMGFFVQAVPSQK